MNKELCIEVKNIDQSFGKVRVLENVTFSIEKGEFVGVFGPNGGGKTTLLRLLMGFQSPENGSIKIFNKSSHQMRSCIGYVPQINRFDKDFPITVLEVVLMGFLSSTNFWGRITPSAKEKAYIALEKVGLLNKKDLSFGSLSGGQAQRVLIARAIANDPKILFLDEPTASIDPEAENDILQILSELKNHVTIVMVTHDLQTILNKVEKLLCVHRSVHTLRPDQVCEHFGLGLYHSPILPINLLKKRTNE